ATFNLQSRFDLNTGTLEKSGATPLFQGESTIGLKGPYGGLRLGRALTPMWAQDWLYDPWENFDRLSSVAWFVFHPSYLSDPYHNGPNGEYSRMNNSVFYDSPNLGGFHFNLVYQVEKDQQPDLNDHTDQTHGKGATLNYDNGPFSMMLAAEENEA